MFSQNFATILTSLLFLAGLSSAIFNGQPTAIRKYPYMASFKERGTVYAAGVILDENWILTPASNLVWYDITNLEIRVGTNLDYDPWGQSRTLQKMIIHPNWTDETFDYDIAVVKVSTPMKLGPKVAGVSLATKTLAAKRTPYVLGWGQTNSSGLVSPQLLHCRVTVLNWNTCLQQYPDLTDRRICTFDTNGNGPCLNDYGAPLIIDGVVYGLFSDSLGCIPGQSPLVYTDISKFYTWVQDTIKQN